MSWKKPRLFETAREAIADLHFVFATTARERGQMKRVFSPDAGMADARQRLADGQGVGILFGRERTGLENDEISLADAIITFPVDAQVLLAQPRAGRAAGGLRMAKARGGGAALQRRRRSPPAERQTVTSFFDYLEAELEAVNFYPPDKQPIMARNMRDIFHRLEMTEQDVRTLRGAIQRACRKAGGSR